MKVCHYTEVTPEEPAGYAPEISLRNVIGPADGAPNFTMRVFELAAHGATPRHSHAWEHEVFVLGGEGAIRTEEGESALREGIVAFVPGGAIHQFVNLADAPLRFICVIPNPKA